MKKLIPSLFLLVGLLWLAVPLMHATEDMSNGSGICATHCIQEAVFVPTAAVPAPLQQLMLGLILAPMVLRLFGLVRKHFVLGYAARPRPAPDLITLYGRFLI